MVSGLQEGACSGEKVERDGLIVLLPLFLIVSKCRLRINFVVFGQVVIIAV